VLITMWPAALAWEIDSEPMADEPLQMSIFFPCSLVRRRDARIVGRCMFSVDDPRRVPGGV
jgi:hypothetical protein